MANAQRARAISWRGGETASLPSRLFHSPRMEEPRTSYMVAPSAVYHLLVNQAVPPADLRAFSVAFDQHLHPLLKGMPRKGIMSNGSWQIELTPEGPHFAELFRSFSSGGCFPFSWGTRGIVSIPVIVKESSNPIGAVELLIRNIPIELSKSGLPEAMLSLGGYIVTYPTSSAAPLYPALLQDQLYVLSCRLGDNPAGFMDRYNASAMIVTILPPPNDPFLRDIPISCPVLGHQSISILIRDDPLNAHGGHQRPSHPLAQAGYGLGRHGHAPRDNLPGAETLPAGWTATATAPPARGPAAAVRSFSGSAGIREPEGTTSAGSGSDGPVQPTGVAAGLHAGRTVIPSFL